MVTRLWFAARRWFWTAIELVWPARCVGCGELRSWWCADCDSQIAVVGNPACPDCRRLTGDGRFCPRCRSKTELTGVSAGAYYRQIMPQLIQAYKYRRATVLAPILSRYQLLALSRVPGLSRAVLVPVPLHQGRLRARGFSQTRLLARHLSQATGIPVADQLKRTRPTRRQAGLSRTSRAANVAGAFRWVGPPLAGKQPLLIDDVYTTGATLSACAAALRSAGARQVWGVVAAQR